MNTENLRFSTFFWRITSSHVITYFLMGVLASTLLDYKVLFETPPLSYLMRPVDSPWVALGPALQVFRGLVFALALWLFKDRFLFQSFGWLKLWGLLVGLSVLSTTGAAPGSIEGLIYTNVPVSIQLGGYLEVLPQTLLFSWLVWYWYKKPGKIWNILSVILVLLIVLMSIMGWLAATQQL